METTNEMTTWEFAEGNLCDAVGLTVRCHQCKTKGWTVRLNPEITLSENLRRISIARYICNECTDKAKEELSMKAVVLA